MRWRIRPYQLHTVFIYSIELISDTRSRMLLQLSFVSGAQVRVELTLIEGGSWPPQGVLMTQAGAAGSTLRGKVANLTFFVVNF